MTVSIGLPVYNGGEHIAKTITSILAQDHEDLQLVICDNASTDVTEEICRDLAASDGRVLYHRQPRNLGTIPNFMSALELAKGEYFRWIGDDDRLEPHYVTRVLREFELDPAWSWSPTRRPTRPTASPPRHATSPPCCAPTTRWTASPSYCAC